MEPFLPGGPGARLTGDPRAPSMDLSGLWKAPACCAWPPGLRGLLIPYVSSSGAWQSFICDLELVPKRTAFLRDTNTLEPTNLFLQSIMLFSVIEISPGRPRWKKHPGESGFFWAQPGLSPHPPHGPIGCALLGTEVAPVAWPTASPRKAHKCSTLSVPSSAGPRAVKGVQLAPPMRGGGCVGKRGDRRFEDLSLRWQLPWQSRSWWSWLWDRRRVFQLFWASEGITWAQWHSGCLTKL